MTSLPDGNGAIPVPETGGPFHDETSGRAITSDRRTKDAGQKWDWSNSNYMFTTFEVTSEDMAKFAQAMTQKMQEKAAPPKPDKKSK